MYFYICFIIRNEKSKIIYDYLYFSKVALYYYVHVMSFTFLKLAVVLINFIIPQIDILIGHEIVYILKK